MSAYDDAVAYLDAEVHPRCDYDIYSDMRDIVDEMEAENAKLRKLLVLATDMARDYDGDRRLLRRLVQEIYEDQCDECDKWKYRDRMRELGIEVTE